MALALTIGGLTACGRGGDDKPGGGLGGSGSGTSASGGSYVNAAVGKENVYRFQELDLLDIHADDISIRDSYLHNDKVYVLIQAYHWEENSQTDYRVLTMDKDGSNMELIKLQVPGDENEDGLAGEDKGPGQDEGGENEDGPAADDKAPAREEEGDSDGDAAEDAETGSDADYAVEDPMPMEIWEYTNYNTFVFGSDAIYCIKNYNYENYTDPENYISQYLMYVCSWNYDGSFRWETELGGMRSDEEYIYVNTMVETSEGNVELFMTGNSGYQQSVGTDGSLGERRPLDDEISDMLSYSGYVLPRGDGTLSVLYYGDDYMSMNIVSYDAATGTLSEPYKLPSVFGWSANSITVGQNSDLLYTSNVGVFSYNIGDEDSVEKMNFINSDLNVTYLQGMLELSADSILAFFYEEGKTKGGIFTYVPPEEIPDKMVIVVGCYYMNYDIRQRVVEFNRSSEDYRIAIRTYDSYDSYEDYYAGLDKLNSDIITGNMPDILVVESNLPVNNYINKGLLADIGQLIENDEELSQVEFVQNVFDAYSVNGKLYQVIPQFNIRTMIAKTSWAGDRTSWTMEEMLQALDSMPEGAVAIEGMTRGWFFNLMMSFCGSDFVDVDTGKCNFNTDNFIAMMEYAKSLPEEIQYDEDYWMSNDSDSQYREDRTLLCSAYLSRVRDLNYYMNGYFGEDISFIGFPTDSDQGSIVAVGTTYAISAKTENMEGAWQFLRYYLTEEYQKENNYYDFSVRKDCFEEMAKEALQRPYWEDEEGNREEYDETFYMNGEEIVLPPLTQEQVDKIVNFIYSVDKPVYYNEDVTNIINEEMEAFYSGQKTARDVAGIIQNRVQLFVDENS